MDHATVDSFTPHIAFRWNGRVGADEDANGREGAEHMNAVGVMLIVLPLGSLVSRQRLLSRFDTQSRRRRPGQGSFRVFRNFTPCVGSSARQRQE